MKYGTLYLIPSPLGDKPASAINSSAGSGCADYISEVLPSYVIEKLCSLQYFVVEEISTARRFLSKAGMRGKIGELNFYELNEHTELPVAQGYVKLLLDGHDVGLISEAGLPAVADPGNILVAQAHKFDIKVVPMTGPSSLMMALMSSGLNGQCFAFNGYIPVKEGERRARIKELEGISKRQKQSQLLIETPYRNDALFADILTVCSGETKVCVAADITLPSEFIRTKTVAEWKKLNFKILKRPCVFIIQG